MDKTVIARTPEEMEEIGVDLAATLDHGMIVSIIGPLGAGKTTLVKGIAKGLLITEAVVSPTYLLARDYDGTIPLHHLDAYRVDSLRELDEVGLVDLLPPETGVSVIEWPERIDGLVELSDLLVQIDHQLADERVVTVRQTTPIARESRGRTPHSTPPEGRS
ncbi:MAG: tRNA (adenosine(37)-N6)-threonylcarbamoyltransferase complex ATPase subunit type 1 TsaE [Candidatus Bipolaricaulota bacterium]|nr:MAG: tRNA (adenosine(37)-N6)-threonylcarbamoyltransferase complex ATPase subunit type 1 TsaE [Candidatus Bipolaricaulota bacterium]